MEFINGEVTDITANVIDERMYTKCNKDGNDMLLLISFVDYIKTERSLLLQDQKLKLNWKPRMKRLSDR